MDNNLRLPRFNSLKPFMVGQLTFTNIQDAVDAAAAASKLKENAFVAQICQPLKNGVYGYAGTSIAFATFRNGIDLDTLAADEDGVPDEDMRAAAFRPRG